MKFSYKTLERIIPDIPPIESVAEKITAHLFEIESYENSILDIKILPNRYSDAACYRGIAREIAAMCKLSYKAPKYSAPKAKHKDITNPVIEVPNLCRRLMTCQIHDIAIGTTPAWMKEALETYGIRSINGIVDITNYVTIETGQPLHAFDTDTMEGNELVVRQAHEGEVVTTLDGKEVVLTPSALVLSDSRHALDIAGIKGGTRAEITRTTKNIVLTAGNFDGTLIYKTARRIGITTDASIRFSHAISPDIAVQGMHRALELITEICGGSMGSICDTYPKPIKPITLFFDIKRFNNLAGLNLKESACLATLASLGFTISGKKITVPLERTDISRFEDIVEEILRLHGYADVPATPPSIAVMPLVPEPMRALKDDIQNTLVTFGYTEILTRSFSSDGEVALENPLSPEQSFLRMHLKEGIVNALALNAKAFDTVALFEIGSVFTKKTTHEPHEDIHCAIALKDKRLKDEDTFRSVRGAIDALCTKLGISNVEYAEDGATLTIAIHTEVIGTITYLAHEGGGTYAEFSLSKIMPHTTSLYSFTPISRYPSITRDVSFITNTTLKAGALLDAAWHDVPHSVTDIRFMGVYAGKGIPEGKKSTTLRFVFQSKDKTLTDTEADDFLSYIMDAMRERVEFEIK